MTIVAVTMNVWENSTYPETRDGISHDWIRFLDQLGITPLLIPNSLANPAQQCQKTQVCGILLVGGNDVGPQANEKWPPSASVAQERDRAEHAIVQFGLEQGIPMIGVCRGMQFINTYFGGTLVRDLLTETEGETHVAMDHRLKIVDARFREILKVDMLTTNSFHDQGVTLETLAPCLKPIALSEAGVVEALYHPELPLLGMQWHPERPNPDPQTATALFSHWLGWCISYSQAKHPAGMV